MKELYVIQCNDDPYCAPYAEKICVSLEDAVKEASHVSDFARIELFSGSGNVLESAERFWNKEGREIEYNGLPVYQVGDDYDIAGTIHDDFDDELIDKIANDPKIYNQARDEADDGQEPDHDEVLRSVKYIADKYNMSMDRAKALYTKATMTELEESVYNEINNALKNAGIVLNEAEDDIIELDEYEEDEADRVRAKIYELLMNNSQLFRTDFGGQFDSDDDIECEINDIVKRVKKGQNIQYVKQPSPDFAEKLQSLVQEYIRAGGRDDVICQDG